MSPLESESRMAAQFAPFETVDWIPYFLNKPFSCAITMGELSVSAMIPNLSWLTSGPSLADNPPAQPRGNPAQRLAREIPAVAPRNWRRGNLRVFCEESFMRFDRCDESFGEIAEPHRAAPRMMRNNKHDRSNSRRYAIARWWRAECLRLF